MIVRLIKTGEVVDVKPSSFRDRENMWVYEKFKGTLGVDGNITEYHLKSKDFKIIEYSIIYEESCDDFYMNGIKQFLSLGFEIIMQRNNHALLKYNKKLNYKRNGIDMSKKKYNYR